MPAAMTAQALGARRSIQSQVRIGWPVFWSVPNDAQYPSALFFLVRNRSFDYQNERRQFARDRPVKRLQEGFAVFIARDTDCENLL